MPVKKITNTASLIPGSPELHPKPPQHVNLHNPQPRIHDAFYTLIGAISCTVTFFEETPMAADAVNSLKNDVLIPLIQAENTFARTTGSLADAINTDTAWTTFENAYHAAAAPFALAVSSLRNCSAVWNDMDKRLREIMEFFEVVGTHSGGGDPTPSWGPLFSSGAPSSSTSIAAIPSSP